MTQMFDENDYSCYYAHCMAIYDTEQEERDLETLDQLGFTVFNPNNAQSSAGYEKEGMGYFMKIIRKCDSLAFRANPDGSIPAGVAKEVSHAKALGKPVIELPCAISRRSLTIDETREWLKECGQR